MSEHQNKSHPIIYTIKINGYLEDHWLDWFEGLTFTHATDGTTILHGPLPDQSTLHGVLLKIRDLNLTLISVFQGESNPEDTPSPNQK